LGSASTDSKPHKVSLYLDVDPRIAVNSGDEDVVWSRSKAPGLHVLNIGSRDQRVLNRAGDDLRIDWGYFHLAVPETEQASLANSARAAHTFLEKGELPPQMTWTCPPASAQVRRI